jgi:hypothetical protein
MRLASVHTTDFGFTLWEIHTSECEDVTKAIHRGSFIAIVSADSPEELIEAEIAACREQGLEEENFKIMPCCVDSDKCMNAATRQTAHRIPVVCAA